MGLPCEHIVCVMLHLKMDKLPDSVVLQWWTKKAKAAALANYTTACKDNRAVQMLKRVALNDYYRIMCNLVCRSGDMYEDTCMCVKNKIRRLNEESIDSVGEEQAGNKNVQPSIRDPKKVRTKGSSKRAADTYGKKKRVTHCSLCHEAGHNRITCHLREQQDERHVDGFHNVDGCQNRVFGLSDTDSMDNLENANFEGDEFMDEHQGGFDVEF